MPSAEARFSKSLRPRKPEGSLGWTAQDVHLDSHTAPKLCSPPLSGDTVILAASGDHAGPVGVHEERVACCPPDDVELHVLGCRVDILGTNCGQCLSMVQCCFTSTETVRLIGTGSPGRPPRLSHSF